MKCIVKLAAWLMITIAAVIVAIFIMLQTQWGTAQLTKWINSRSGYQLTVDNIIYRLSSPTHLVLKNVTFGRKDQAPGVTAQTIDIGLSSRHLFHPRMVLLQNGTLRLASDALPEKLQADRLQLSSMALHIPAGSLALSAEHVNGSVTPWHPTPGRILGTTSQFQMSAGALSLGHLPATNVLVQGRVDGDKLTLSTIGADVAQGSLTGSVQRNASGDWEVDRLQLGDIRLQSDKTPSAFLSPLTYLPSLDIKRLDITDARLQGTDWAVTDLNVSLRGIAFIQGNWQSQAGKLLMNASEVVAGPVHLIDPGVNANFSRQGIKIRQFRSRWESGLVRVSGQWLRDSQQLLLDDVTLVGLEYTLPGNWKALWMKTLPAWLKNLIVSRVSVSRCLLIDIDPAFPFQLTSLQGTGNNMQLVNEQQWGIWAGKAAFDAVSATFNKVDVSNPSIVFDATPSAITIGELSAFPEKGLLEATATISQQPDRQITLNLNGWEIPVAILQKWGWPNVPLKGEGNLQLTATGNMHASMPLKSSVNAKLHVIDTKGKRWEQIMRQGNLIAPSLPTTTEAQPAGAISSAREP